MGGFYRKYVEKRKKPVQKEIKQSQTGPTKAEMDAIRLASIKRKGRKSTKLGMEDEDLYLSTRVLLG
jgi:hypothetical protein